jgi:hypothetical protein
MVKKRSVSNSTATPSSTQPARKSKRPFSATLLTWVVLIIASLNWLRLITIIRQWTFLESLLTTLPLLYLAVTGLIWGLLGAILVWGLYLGLPWAPRLMRITAPIYAAIYWIDRVMIADHSAIANRWPFALGLTIFLIIFTFWVLSRPKAKKFYKIQNPDRF